MAVQLESPYEGAGNIWLRGNLHTHTRLSDGSVLPQTMILAYAAHRYDFLAISDHDVLPLAADAVNDCGMILLPAMEISANGCAHMLCIGSCANIRQPSTSQQKIDDISKEGGLAILCHPNSGENFDHYPWKLLNMLSGYTGLEIFNGLAMETPGSHLAVDKWDRVLSTGRMVWGFANDDAHAPDEVVRGWNMVLVRERTPEAILAALRRGSFYASSGVVIDKIDCSGARLRIRTTNAQSIALFGLSGTRVHVVEGPDLTFNVSGFMDPYLRAECYGRGGTMAWTQPIRVRGGTRKSLRVA
jgi:hypothetical protein